MLRLDSKAHTNVEIDDLIHCFLYEFGLKEIQYDLLLRENYLPEPQEAVQIEEMIIEQLIVAF